MELSCIALAGGKSSRLGRNKLTEIIGEQTLLERVLTVLSKFKSQIILVTSPQATLPSTVEYPTLKIVNDLYPGTGSLGGIYTGLASSETHYNLVVACDMPFLNADLLRYMIDISPGFDLVAYNQEERPEMLHAIYSRNCLAPMESLIQENSLRIVGILPHIKVRYLTTEEIEKFDPQKLSFFNINTEEELQKARELVRPGIKL